MSGAQIEQALSMTGAMLTPVGIVVAGLISGVIFGFIVALVVSAFTGCADPRAVICSVCAVLAYCTGLPGRRSAPRAW